MPGYPKSMYAEPKPTEEVATTKSRFSMPALPQLTIIQMVLVALIAGYAFTSRKMNGVVVASLALTVGLLHMYDHLYRIKRGPEKLFFLPQAKKEGYSCCGK
jgi:hypothetical protein|tara:strand:- start:400 stop:705 length:306 start_codon:yes stop_codon:yes gene_type:complete